MTEPTYPESFADYPKSLTEHKADKAQDWTIRDALIAALRHYDSGHYAKHDQCMLLFSGPLGTLEAELDIVQCVPTTMSAIGLLSWAQVVTADRHINAAND